LKLRGIPFGVGSRNFALPVFFDDILEVLAVCRRRIGNVVVRKPAFKLSFMPFVVDYVRIDISTRSILWQIDQDEASIPGQAS
jgi:hypothetical protein